MNLSCPQIRAICITADIRGDHAHPNPRARRRRSHWDCRRRIVANGRRTSGPVIQSQSPPTVAQDVRLAAATVPPGGLLTSFVGNQFIYCSIIARFLVQTAVTLAATTLAAPGTFLTALQSVTVQGNRRRRSVGDRAHERGSGGSDRRRARYRRKGH